MGNSVPRVHCDMRAHRGKSNLQSVKTYTPIYHHVVAILAHPNAPREGAIPLASSLADIVLEYSGDHIIHRIKQFEWPSRMGKTLDTTFVTRRTRMLDRLVLYGEEYGYSHADVYDAMWALGPCIEPIVKVNRGQEWESSDDWYIYDIFAKIALLSIPGRSEKFIKEKGHELVSEIHRIYDSDSAEKISHFCQFLEEQLRRTNWHSNNITFGQSLSECLEHYCAIASNDLPTDSEEISRLISCAHYIMHFTFMHPKLWFTKPDILVAVAVNSALTFLGTGSWGNWYEVKCRTAVRHGILLDSNTVRLLNPGARVHIVQKFGRRAQIDQPAVGFCSLHDGAGLDILLPISENHLLTKLTGMDHESMQSPFRDMTRWVFTDRTNVYANLKSKFSKQCYESVSSMVFNNGQLVQADQMLFEE